MKKKGSHVGIVLSFVIFVTFLVFLYSVVEPMIRTQGNKQLVLDYLEAKLTEKCSANLTSVAITNSSPIQEYDDCLVINNTKLELKEFYSIVKDKDKKIVNSTSSEDLLKIAWNGETFFNVYYSEEPFENFSTSNNNCVDSIIESIKTKKYIFETKIIDLINEYKNNYKSLKEELMIPAGIEFSFSFTYNNETIIKTKETEVSTSVYLKKIPIHYIDKKANILPGVMTIKVW